MGSSDVTPAMVRLVYPTSLTDEALEMLIASAESELENFIGPLQGPIVQSVEGTGITAMILARRPDSGSLLLSTTAGAIPITDWTIGADWRKVINTTTVPWVGPVTVTYFPDDLALVQMSVIDLAAMQSSILGAGSGGYKKERLGEYSYEMWTGAEMETTRRSIYRRFRYNGYGPIYTVKLVPIGASDP